MASDKPASPQPFARKQSVALTTNYQENDCDLRDQLEQPCHDEAKNLSFGVHWMKSPNCPLWKSPSNPQSFNHLGHPVPYDLYDEFGAGAFICQRLESHLMAIKGNGRSREDRRLQMRSPRSALEVCGGVALCRPTNN